MLLIHQIIRYAVKWVKRTTLVGPVSRVSTAVAWSKSANRPFGNAARKSTAGKVKKNDTLKLPQLT